MNGAKLTTIGGNIQLTGKGGGTGSRNFGILQQNSAQVSSVDGNITYMNTGGNGIDENLGIFLTDAGTKITTTTGAINLTGTGNGTSTFNLGILQQNSAQVSSVDGNITYTGTGASGADAIFTSGDSNIIGNDTAGKISFTSTNNGITLNDVEAKTTNNITIDSPAVVTQNSTGNLLADGLELLGGGEFILTNPNNDINTLAGNTTNAISYNDINGFSVEIVNSTTGIITNDNNLTLTSADNAITFAENVNTGTGNISIESGTIDQTGGTITTTGTASFRATQANTGNVIAKNTTGTVLSNSKIGGSFTLTSSGNVTQTVGTSLKVAGVTNITAQNGTSGLTESGNFSPNLVDSNDNLTITGVGTVDLSIVNITGNLTVNSLESRNAYSAIFGRNAINLNQGNSFGGVVSFNTQTAGFGAVTGTPSIT